MEEKEENARMLDRQRLSDDAAKEFDELQRLIKSVIARETANEASSEGNEGNLTGVLTEWYNSVAEEPPETSDAGFKVDKTITRSYQIFAIEGTGGNRTYRVNAHVDNAFGSALINRIRQIIALMLNRIAAGQTALFIRRAQRHGLSWRRSRRYPFPHPLPYLSPPPTTNDQIYAEEAGVIEAAFHFPLMNAAPGIKLVIDEFSDGPSSGGYWVLGSADVNSYNYDRIFEINLNSRAFPEFTDNTWAGTIAHEMMHNLGWGHPDGTYVPQIAIVNYDRCIRGVAARLADDEDDSKQIR